MNSKETEFGRDTKLVGLQPVTAESCTTPVLFSCRSNLFGKDRNRYGTVFFSSELQWTPWTSTSISSLCFVKLSIRRHLPIFFGASFARLLGNTVPRKRRSNFERPIRLVLRLFYLIGFLERGSNVNVKQFIYIVGNSL